MLSAPFRHAGVVVGDAAADMGEDHDVGVGRRVLVQHFGGDAEIFLRAVDADHLEPRLARHRAGGEERVDRDGGDARALLDQAQHREQA